MKPFSQKTVPPYWLPPQFPFPTHLHMVGNAKFDGGHLSAGDAGDREVEIFIQHADFFMASDRSGNQGCSGAGKSENDNTFLLSHGFCTNS